MIKVSVMYPHTPGCRFDHDYYVNKHMVLVAGKLGSALKGYSVDKGVCGRTPDAPPTYVAVCHMLFESPKDFQTAFAPHGAEFAADGPNYTDVKPVLQISDVLVG